MILLLALWGCTDPIVAVTGDDALVFKKADATPAPSTPTTAWISVDLQGVDSGGAAIPCEDGQLTVDVTVTLPDGTTTTIAKQQQQLVCGPDRTPDVTLVLDNSGSQDDVVEATREGARALTHDVLDAGGRVGLVRVSTFSHGLVPLGDDDGDLDAAIDGLFVNRGWTALWDGVRMGNETLAAGQTTATTPTSLAAYCAARRSPSMVVFSNGVDNNSAELKLSGAGDGIDTTFDDVAGMTIGGVATPIHTIGLGRDLDDQILADLSIATGGTHLSLAGEGWIADAFDLASTWDDATWRLCAEVTSTTCGEAEIDVTYELKRKCNQGLGNGAEGCDPGDSNHHNPSNDEPGSPGRGNGDPQSDAAGTTWVTAASGTRTVTVHLPCGDAGQHGRAAALLLPLDAPGTPSATAATLVRDTVAWAAGGTGSRKVAVYHDDTGDDADALLVAQVLREAGHTVLVAREPDHGLRQQDVAGFDVVWFSAPGRPMDDYATLDLLRWHVGTGHGVVLQGADLGRALGGAFEPVALAGVAFVDDGVEACGVRPGEDGTYDVAFGTGTHPILAGLAGAHLTVDDDLDLTRPLGVGEQVLAWADLDGVEEGCSVHTPAVIALQR